MAGIPVAMPVAAPVEDPAAVLDAMPAVFIKQQISLTEVLSGCEMRNKYWVYPADPATLEQVQGRDPLFRCLEESSCFQRQCCGPHREFNLDTFLRDRQNPMEGRGAILTHAFRPFKCCEFMCFNRPEMFVKNAQNQQIGHVYNPFTCCSWDVDVGGPSDKRPDQGPADPKLAQTLPWKLTATCCQLGIYCRCPCEPCKRVIFEIRDTNDTVVGELQHVFAGCCKDIVDVDNYAIRFPAGATWQQKATLINCAVLIDFLFFERKNDGGGGGGS